MCFCALKNKRLDIFRIIKKAVNNGQTLQLSLMTIFTVFGQKKKTLQFIKCNIPAT